MLPLVVTVGLAAATFLPLLAFEALRPLRETVEPKARRLFRNLVVAVLSLSVVAFLQAPLLAPLTRWMEGHRVGLLNLVGLPRAVEVAVAVLLLDYTLWHWHRINHRVPFFWRFHLVHHADRDLDASTALRFHFGEMALSVPYRALQVLVIGADPFALSLWQTVLLPSILFHHSNVRLPLALERALVPLIVTPRMHGIHHSQVREETDTNFASLFTVWDWLHRTLRLDVPQREVAIGVPAYRDPRLLTLGRMLLQPFRRQRADWSGSPPPHPGAPDREFTLAA